MASSTPPVQGVPPSCPSIESLIRSAQAGSQTALGQMLEASRKYLLMAANRGWDADLRPKAGASDLVQDTFVEAHRDFGRFSGTTQNELHAWLAAILENRMANVARHYKRTQKRNISRELPLASNDVLAGDLCDDKPTPATTGAARDDQKRVQTALNRLPAPLREVLIERAWQRSTFAEIGARRGCSAEAARKIWCRAVRHLQEILGETS